MILFDVHDSTSYMHSAGCVCIVSGALLIVPNLHGNLEKLSQFREENNSNMYSVHASQK